MMLFDWLYPNYTPVLHRAIEIWYSEPSVTTPVLKLMAELAQNRYGLRAKGNIGIDSEFWQGIKKDGTNASELMKTWGHFPYL